MSERRGTKALELWCRRITDGYPGVSVQNMTTSWRDGLAFCAMIHHFRPDLIDFGSLNKDDIYRNNELAFRTAEQHLGIPALLDAEDMASCAVPDRLSILTYLSQFYQVFGGSSPSKLALNRTSESSSQRIGSVPESPQAKVSSRLGMRRESCASCGLPVFLAEKLVVARSSYHRSCFRCARCRHQLTPGNYYETESGEFCCEACPEDVVDEQPAAAEERSTVDVLEAPLSDEEKSKRRSLERSVDALLRSQRSKIDLMASQLLGQKIDEQQVPVPTAESDEEKTARQQQQMSAEEPPPAEPEEKFDEMIKLISERIDELSSEDRPETVAAAAAAEVETTATTSEKTVEEVEREKEPRREAESKPSPSTRRREQRVHSAPNVSPDARRARSDDESEKSIRRSSTTTAASPLRRSSSLRSSAEHTKDTERPLSRLSFVRRSLRFLDSDRRRSKDDKKKPVGVEATKDATPPEQDYPDELNPFASDDEPKASTNPFGSSDEEEAPPKPVARLRRSEDAPKKRLIEAPAINLNPFWSDDEEPVEHKAPPPVPKPRTLRHSHVEAGLQPKSNLTISSLHSSNTSIASSCSTATTPGGTYRKKKPAPPIPNLSTSMTPTRPVSATSSANVSPRLTPRTRKSKPAPAPPAAASTPTPRRQSIQSVHGDSTTQPKLPPDNDTCSRAEEPGKQRQLWDDEKLSKDEANRTTQSLSSSSCADSALYPTLDKSVEGKWKRKKGPAPARPMPLRRKIKVMSMKDVKLELDQIEMQQQGLERQGVRLEQIIRDKCESGTVSEETSLGMDVEELVLELFALVNEKNELFRRQAELMLLRRQQRLEEEHADIEYQVRCLIIQPEATKTDFDKQREETLIQRLVDIVQKRNEIVECLEMDRRREIEEDRSIHREMDLYAARSKTDTLNMTDESRRSSKLKKCKVKEKTKEKKSKKSNKKDADKDVDETEAKQKRHSLRKWF